MAFTVKQAKCKTCGGINIVPAGKLSGRGYDDCLKCRDKKAAEFEPGGPNEGDEFSAHQNRTATNKKGPSGANRRGH